MVPFMDVNNMNDYEMVNPAESKGADAILPISVWWRSISCRKT